MAKEVAFKSPYPVQTPKGYILSNPVIQKFPISESNTANETDVIIYTVPNDYYLVLLSCWLSWRTTTTIAGTGSCRVYINGLNGSILYSTIPNLQNLHNTITQQYGNGVVLSPKTVIRVSNSTGNANTLISTGGIFGYLVMRNEYEQNRPSF